MCKQTLVINKYLYTGVGTINLLYKHGNYNTTLYIATTCNMYIIINITILSRFVNHYEATYQYGHIIIIM